MLFRSWIKACVTSPSYSICINGELNGYFMGKRGLRQGDPLSPYLFVIVMEILTRILAEKANDDKFKFHWRCEKLKLINLCFADDLMIFCRGESNSVGIVTDGLSEFSKLSGLKPSPGKSHIFFSGVKDEVRDNILLLSGFQIGSLPVKYLGVPLITTKLKSSDSNLWLIGLQGELSVGLIELLVMLVEPSW